MFIAIMLLRIWPAATPAVAPAFQEEEYPTLRAGTDLHAPSTAAFWLKLYGKASEKAEMRLTYLGVENDPVVFFIIRHKGESKIAC
ncbi:MAG TPA: hypothetical protein VN604_03095 [Nitrospirota bacterium]|nr:hypothetical protein [Nitrospirota bacterium]